MKFKIISLLASIGLLAILLLYSNISEVAVALSKSKPEFVAAGLAVSTLAMLTRAFRWKWLLRSISIDMRFGRIFPIFMTGLFISNITPAKTGEPFRSYLLKRKEGIGFTSSISSVIIERIFDLLTLIAISIAGIFFVQHFMFALILDAVVVLYLAIIALVIFVCTSRNRVERFSGILVKVFGWIPIVKRIGKGIDGKAGNINESFMKYRGWKIISRLALFSIFIWLLDAIVGYSAFSALGIQIDLPLFLFIMSVSVLIGIATSLPGGIGSTDAVMALLASAAFGIGLPIATAGILLFRFLTIWYNMAVGALLLSSAGK